jgi:eukaryotic-like serine/threonine-protein kinase
MRAHETMPTGKLIPLDLARLPPPRRSRFGDYDVITPLARGGMGNIYLAEHVETHQRVALKVLDPQFANHPDIVDRLYAEHALSARASHPNLLEVYSAERSTDNVPYLVMEYLDGETLAAISEREQLGLGTVLSVGAQIAAALAALHEGGVIHCDVKHDNVLVLSKGDHLQVKLLDFGVSRLVDEPPAEDSAIAGTPWCMAPEQWEGKPGTASDVYALGCLLYDLITGFPPFEGSLPELMIAHLEQRPARPSWLAPCPTVLERLIMRALSKDPAHRPTMAELAFELELLVEHPPVALRAAG